MKVSKNIDVREVVPPEIWNVYGKNSIWFIDERLIILLQFIHDYFDAELTSNNYHYHKAGMPGPYTQRGFRMPDSTIGAKLSTHKRSIADDFTLKGHTPDEIRAEILRNQKPFMEKGLTTLEHGDDAPTWVHGDMRWTGLDHILIVRG